MTGRIEASTIQKSGNRTMIRMASTPTMVSACPMMRRPLYRRGDIVIAHAAAGSPKIQQGGDYKGYKHNDTHRRAESEIHVPESGLPNVKGQRLCRPQRPTIGHDLHQIESRDGGNHVDRC